MSIGHVVGAAVELGVLSTCIYVFRAPGTCIFVSKVAHESVEAIVDIGLKVGIEGIKAGAINVATFSEMDPYKLALQIGGSIAVSAAIGPIGFVAGTLISFASTAAIGEAYDWATGHDHDHSHPTGDTPDHDHSHTAGDTPGHAHHFGE
jgi:hypothetical protein